MAGHAQGDHSACNHGVDAIANLLEKNKHWREAVVAQDPNFFKKQANGQAPPYLWVGCADSRVPPNQVLDVGPGEVFVQRNVGNLASHKDMNWMATLEYTVDHLKVQHILVCGHYNCGAVKASLVWEPKVSGVVNLWLADIRSTRNAHQEGLKDLSDDEKWDKMCELNVVSQVFNVCTNPIVQAAWDRGQKLSVHGLIYSPGDGLLKELVAPIDNPAKVMPPQSPEAYKHKQADRATELVGEYLGVHMSFTHPHLAKELISAGSNGATKAGAKTPVRASATPVSVRAFDAAVPGFHRAATKRAAVRGLYHRGLQASLRPTAQRAAALTGSRLAFAL